METEAPQNQDNTEPDTQDALEGLDEEQLKAFESIMAQIEGSEARESEVSPDIDVEEAVAEPAPELNEEAFGAELESVVEESALSMEPPAEGKNGEDGLDDEQMKAFESIMSQIESPEATGKDEGSLPSEPDTPATDHEKSNLAEPGSTTADSDGHDDSVGEATVGSAEELEKETTESSIQDISGDIEDLLSSIADEKDETALEEGDAIVLTQIEHSGEDRPGPVQKSGTKENESENEGSTISSEVKSEEQKAVLENRGPEKTEAPETEEIPERQPEPAPLISEAPPRKRHRGIFFFSVTFLVILLVSAGIYWKWGTVLFVGEPQSHIDVDTHAQPGFASNGVIEEKTAIEDSRENNVLRLENFIASVAQLRDEVTNKRHELQTLREYYQTGIEDEIAGLAALIPATRQKFEGGEPFPDDPKIRLGLEAIQRRGETIKRLKKPSEQLHRINEELLFLSRKAKMLSLMVGKTSDIDVDTFLEKSKMRCDRLRIDTDSLTLDGDAFPEIGLAAIWQRVVQNSKTQQVSEKRRLGRGPDDNEAIWKEVCEGDYSRKDRLTQLSSGAAECLARWEGKDLYLNRLTSLSPEAARRLSTWNGQWLGLNGLTELTAPTAAELVNWKGRVLSLNGLSRLSPKIVDILSAWQGDQIELINVRHMAHWENPKTRLFLSEETRQQLGKRE